MDPDYWKGVMFAYVGLPQNLKDLKDLGASSLQEPGSQSPSAALKVWLLGLEKASGWGKQVATDVDAPSES